MAEAFVGERDDWVVAIVVPIPDSNPRLHEHNPPSGVMRISYLDAAGTRRYWNGTAFIAGSAINLVPTITSGLMKYPYNHVGETQGLTVLFEAWNPRNIAATYVSREVRVRASAEVADVEFVGIEAPA